MGGVVQKYLDRIKTGYKGSPYHPRTNGKVESLNGLIGSMLTKYLTPILHHRTIYLVLKQCSQQDKKLRDLPMKKHYEKRTYTTK